MKEVRPDDEPALSWGEIGVLCQGLSLAGRTLKSTSKKITEKYSLGPRGAWILVLVLGGEVVYPLDVTNFFRIGRSLITAELNRLNQARLIAQQRTTHDQRRWKLVLTRSGEKAAQTVRDELSNFVMRRLSSYTRAEVLLCSRMLHDLNFADVASAGHQAESS
jgi:DNA-binding MarR family transcriptional regulator